MKNLKAFINWKEYDPQGNLVEEKEHESNSLVTAFLGILLAQMTGVSCTGIYGIYGFARTLTDAITAFKCNAAGADVDNGLVVGTGTTAVATTDYKLVTRIAHGNGAGQLSYEAMNLDTALTVDGTTHRFLIYRQFTNNSGGDITVEEIGLYTDCGSFDLCIDRSLSTKSIVNGNTARLTYTISITV